jgi:hypothetical protein
MLVDAIAGDFKQECNILDVISMENLGEKIDVDLVLDGFVVVPLLYRSENARINLCHISICLLCSVCWLMK